VPTGTLLALTSVLVAVAIFTLLTWRRRLTPEQKEHRRRQLLHREGRILEAVVTGFEGDTLFYAYSLRGVQYSASQDCASLSGLLPEPRDVTIGPASCKYHRANPANSIVLCEEWSGLRQKERISPPL